MATLTETRNTVTQACVLENFFETIAAVVVATTRRRKGITLSSFQPCLDQQSGRWLDCHGRKSRRRTMRSLASVATKQATPTINEIQNTRPVYQKNESSIRASVSPGPRTAATERPATGGRGQAEIANGIAFVELVTRRDLRTTARATARSPSPTLPTIKKALVCVQAYRRTEPLSGGKLTPPFNYRRRGPALIQTCL